jgi:hypothetical protein
MKAVSDGMVSTEDSLVLSCMQVLLRSSSPGQVRESVQRSMDWDLALRIACWRSVPPILHTVLEKFASDILSVNTLCQVHAGFQHA